MPKMQAIYVMANADMTECKIGISKDPNRRATSLPDFAPYWTSHLRSDAREVEKIAHEHFEQWARGNERFGVSPMDAMAFICQQLEFRGPADDTPIVDHKTVSFRLCPETIKAVKRACIDEGIPMQEWISRAIRRAVENSAQDAARSRNVFFAGAEPGRARMPALGLEFAGN